MVAIVLFVISSTVVIWPDAVAGHVETVSNQGTPTNYTYDIPLYAGAFLSSPMIRPSGVGANVSLAVGSSGISEGGFLSAGIGVHSADCCTDGIDYGYRLDAVVWQNGSRGIVGSAWEVCDANGACSGHSWKILLFYAAVTLPTQAALPIRLSLTWENRSVVWRYESGASSAVLGALSLPPHANAAFNAGWLGPPDQPSPGGAFFFQFGVTTLSAPTGTWSATLYCPATMVKGKWSCVDHVETIQGGQSFWKILWRWGEDLPRVDANWTASDHSVTFHSSATTMDSFKTLW